MRFFSGRLLRHVRRQELYSWVSGSTIDNNIIGLSYADDHFWILTYNGYLRYSDNLEDWTSCGKINTDGYGMNRFVLANDGSGLALGKYGNSKYHSYSLFTPSTSITDTIGTLTSFSTSGAWSNCSIKDVVYNSENFVVFGFKTKSGGDVGIYSLRTSSFNSPVEMASVPPVHSAFYLNGLYVLLCDGGYVAINDELSANGWDVKQIVDDDIEWRYAARYDNKIVLLSLHADITISADSGVTWSLPAKIPGFSSTTNIIHFIDRFYVFGSDINHNTCYASSASGSTYYPIINLPTDTNSLGDMIWRYSSKNPNKLVISCLSKIKYKTVN